MHLQTKVATFKKYINIFIVPAEHISGCHALLLFVSVGFIFTIDLLMRVFC